MKKDEKEKKYKKTGKAFGDNACVNLGRKKRLELSATWATTRCSAN